MEMLKVTSYEVLGKLPELMKLENGKKVRVCKHCKETF